MRPFARSDQRARAWLLQLGREVTSQLSSRVDIAEIVLNAPSQLNARWGYADGWYVEVGRIVGDRGSGLQLWLDRWPGTATRKLWFGYKGTREDQIRTASSAGTPEFGSALRVGGRRIAYDSQDRVWMMRPPLETFGRPVAESYDDGWGYYGVYLRNTLDFNRAPARGLVARLSTFLERVSLAILGQLTVKRSQAALKTSLEGHSRYRKHRYRERDGALARQAKVRDGYQCRVCKINFEQLYGLLGRGFAEAHHIIPLGQLLRPRENSPDDLVTVCANCHRMLHRLPSGIATVGTLRKRFTGSWPRPRG